MRPQVRPGKLFANGLMLLVFLGFFSLGTLTPWRDLTLTTGGLLLVGTLMVLHARHPPS